MDKKIGYDNLTTSLKIVVCVVWVWVGWFTLFFLTELLKAALGVSP